MYLSSGGALSQDKSVFLSAASSFSFLILFWLLYTTAAVDAKFAVIVIVGRLKVVKSDARQKGEKKVQCECSSL